MHDDKLQEVLIKLAEIKGHIERLVSDAESEKDTRRRRNESFDRELHDLRQEVYKLKEWKSNMQGRLLVTITVASGVWGVIVAVLLKVIK